MISNQGLGSGLDISGIVAALVDVERAPKEAQLDAEEGEVDDRNLCNWFFEKFNDDF